MFAPFLKSVADHIHQNYKDKVEDLCIVLPNKRGALFLKKFLGQSFQKTIWLPRIISAEELIEELSGMQVLNEIDLICHLYESYRTCYGAEAESFDSFAKWGQLILQDFNEIDRYLADATQVYENLREIKVIENWSLGAESLTEYQTNYLRFMASLGAIHRHYTTFLKSKNWAYQGLAYRIASDKIKEDSFLTRFHKVLFCGFNALNAAEIKIFGTLFKSSKADILWDADKYYLNDPSQEAGLFLRNNLKQFQQKDISFVGNYFKTEKNIEIISVPRQMGQAQVIKQTLQKYIDQGIAMDKVAVVLANEKLLWPVLQQLPSETGPVNITMEYPLSYTSAYDLIGQLIHIQCGFEKQKKGQITIFHNDLVNLLRQPLLGELFKAKKIPLNPQSVIAQITKRNLSFIHSKHFVELFGDAEALIREFLQPQRSVNDFCESTIKLVSELIAYYVGTDSDNHRSLELEYLHIILKHFNRLSELLRTYDHFKTMAAFRHLFQQVIGNATAPFIGEPLRGLQIMGVLETRTLDFDHVIMVNVNEGVLPSGKSINSFIPNDLKRAFGLPLYIEKDAIYAYHFYRLLQRAQTAVITYDSETDTFGKGEKSRFLTQLILEMQNYGPVMVTEKVASYPSIPKEKDTVITLNKSKDVLHSIFEKARSAELYGGLSPSGLITYKDCPLKFYFRYGAGLKEQKEVEESAEAGTFGSILHLSLETLYTPFISRVVSTAELTEKKKEIDSITEQSFISFFDNNKPTGKSILQQEVIKVYVRKLMDNDLAFLEKLKNKNQVLTLVGLEKEYTAPLQLHINNAETTIYIKGKVDRIDSFEGILRVIDYKSSVKDTDRFVFTNFDDLFNDKNYNKQLQLFTYGWLLFKNKIAAAEKIRPCVIPFKVFNEEPRYITRDKKPLIFSEEFFLEFEARLIEFIGNIFNQAIPFDQTTDEKTHEFCPYNKICNFET